MIRGSLVDSWGAKSSPRFNRSL